MTHRARVPSFSFYLLLLRLAAWLAPGEARAEWLAEWKAELWHVGRSHGTGMAGAFRGGRRVTAFCLGAFPDALWLRRNGSGRRRMAAWGLDRMRSGSARRCGALLALGAAASLLLGFRLPATRRFFLPEPYQTDSLLVTIQRGGSEETPRPTVRLGDYLSWRTDAGRLFTGLAFYQPAMGRIRTATGRSASLPIARASGNLFDLLHHPVPAIPAYPADDHRASDPPGGARVVLSRKVWRDLFDGDPGIIGRVADVSGERARVAGVLPEDFWRLPGQADAWLLEDSRTLRQLPDDSPGFVLARVRGESFPAAIDGWTYMTVSQRSGETERFACISISQQARQPLSLALFALFLAGLALPATTALALGEYPVGRYPLARAVRARRWIFLAVKLGLVAPIVFFTSVDLAYGLCQAPWPVSIYLQLASSFLGFLFGFRWALRDQRRRCPVCLQLLTNPAQVGQDSRNFLAWHGAELICAGGHGLLHIPEMPTSWFSTQRWLYLDPSWRGLFDERRAGLAKNGAARAGC